MFPSAYFTVAYFAEDYFPPGDGFVPPVGYNQFVIWLGGE